MSSLSFTEIDYLNESRIPPTYSCPTGYILLDRYCELIPNMSCPPGYSLSNGICMKGTPSPQSPVPPPMSPVPPPMSPVPCPDGYTRREDQLCYPIV